MSDKLIEIWGISQTKRKCITVPEQILRQSRLERHFLKKYYIQQKEIATREIAAQRPAQGKIGVPEQRNNKMKTRHRTQRCPSTLPQCLVPVLCCGVI